MGNKSFRKRKAHEYQRKKQIRNIRKILIICEGEKTEPNYFKSFPLNRNEIEVTVLGKGMNTDTLVEFAVKKKKKKKYNQIWCVFDRDSFSSHSFNRALQLARNNKIRVAYSNEAFEIWYLLHFHYYNAGIHRKSYKQKLSDCLGHKYKKNSKKMYEKLKSKQKKAIKFAKKLINSYLPHHNPEKDNPCTTVFLLVKELNRFLE